MRILFKFATRSRPEKYKKCIENIISNVAQKDNFQILVTADTDDTTMNTPEMIQFSSVPGVKLIFGQSISKIDAINRDMNQADAWDILVNTSDDMMFTYVAFDNAIRDDFSIHFPDLDGVLHYNDGNQKDNCMTMSIIGRRYYELDNYIYHPDYQSLWCDKEAELVAKKRKKYKYMGDQRILFKHLHPSFGQTKYDDQYRFTESHNVRAGDQAVYLTRKAKNFNL